MINESNNNYHLLENRNESEFLPTDTGHLQQNLQHPQTYWCHVKTFHLGKATFKRAMWFTRITSDFG